MVYNDMSGNSRIMHCGLLFNSLQHDLLKGFTITPHVWYLLQDALSDKSAENPDTSHLCRIDNYEV